METFDDLVAYIVELQVADGLSDEVRDEVLHALAIVTPPTYEYSSELITLHSRGGGVSRKPGNILLSWRRLFDLVPDVGVAAAGVGAETPFVRGLIGLYVWNKLWRANERTLGDAEASVIEALWQDGAPVRHMSSDEAFARTTALRSTKSVPPMSRHEFERALDTLAGMACIELEEGSVWLREWVRKPT